MRKHNRPKICRKNRNCPGRDSVEQSIREEETVHAKAQKWEDAPHVRGGWVSSRESSTRLSWRDRASVRVQSQKQNC